MKRIICFLMVLILFVLILTSCKKNEVYTVEYPDIYTPEYCRDNYIRASKNLVHIYNAENEIGQFIKLQDVGGWGTYYAIKDVPLDEYLLRDELQMFTDHKFSIVKNKNKALPKDEILSYKISDLKLYSFSLASDDDQNYGSNCVKENVASLDRDKLDSFQTYIQNCIDTKNYKTPKFGNKSYVRHNGLLLYIRVCFSEYQFLAWDAVIIYKDDVYCMEVYGVNDVDLMYIPLSQDIIDLIPPSVTFR